MGTSLSAHLNSRRARQSLAVLAVGSLLTGALATATPAAAAPTGPAKTTKAGKADKLGSHDRDLLAEAQADDKSFVSVMVSARRGEAAQAKREVRALGGSILYAADRYGYFSARIPTAKVTKAAGIDSVLAVDLDEVVPLPDVTPQGNTAAAATYQRPAPRHRTTTPTCRPTRPARSPSRPRTPPGTAKASPSASWTPVSTSCTPRCRRRPVVRHKIVDSFTATDPATEGSLVAGGDATWLPMVQAATGPGVFPASGQYRDAKWKLPAGSYKIRTFDEAGTNVPGCEVCGDVNRDGDTTDRFGVLYDPASHAVRVDSNLNHDFTDDKAMSPFRQQRDMGVFGTDDPKTAVRDQMAFTVDYREDVDVSFFNSPVLGKSWTSSTSASSRASTGRTSPASPPRTTCSAERWTVPLLAPSWSLPGPARSAPAARPSR